MTSAAGCYRDFRENITLRERRQRSSALLTLPVQNGRYAVWDNLPDELVARILARLPFSNSYLARMVCRRWRSIVWSPLFLKFCKQSSRMPWLLEFQQYMYNQVWAYDLSGNRWFHISFSFLPENASVLAAAGGLICLGCDIQDGYVLFLCNPMTRAWRRLPPIPVQPGFVVLDVDPESNLYKLVAVVLRGSNVARPIGSVCVYDSEIHEWRETLAVPWELGTEYVQDATVCDGILYCLTQEDRGGWQGIKSYDLDQGIWSSIIMDGPAEVHRGRAGLMQRRWQQQMLLPQGHANHAAAQNNQVPSPSLQDSYILDRQGQLLMVTSYESKVVLHEFDVNSRSWKQLDLSTGVICAGHFSSLWVHEPEGRDIVYFAHSEKNKCFTSASRSWHWLPNSPLMRNKMQGGVIILKGLWFEPRVDATI